MAKIFISYRRDDSQHAVDRLYAGLKKFVRNPKRDIFIDVDNIPLGVDFTRHLDDRVGQCETLLAVIGPGWLGAADPETGGRRLDDPDDFVRIEIASALKRGIPVVPVLLDGAPVPRADDLPDDLKPLALRNGTVLNRGSFDADVKRLGQGLKGAAAAPSKPAPPKRRSGAAAPIALLLAMAVIGLSVGGFLIDPFDWMGQTPPPSKAAEPVETADDTPLGDAPSVSTGAANPAATPTYRAGQVFRDTLSGGGQGPEMVVIPSGSFRMGSPAGEAGRDSDEGPQRTVRIGYSFAVGKTEVTWAEWEACVADGGCSNSGPDSRGGDQGWGKGARPVINVNWNDSQAYVDWLGRKTGERYRLLSEAEWEYVARAGTTGRFSWGDGDPTCSRGASNGANFSSCTSSRTEPVGYSAANAFGLHDLHGNVWEWVEDCYVDSYSGAPTDGSPPIVSNCSLRVLRGGSWGNVPQGLRSADRSGGNPSYRLSGRGFRVARSLED